MHVMHSASFRATSSGKTLAINPLERLLAPSGSQKRVQLYSSLVRAAAHSCVGPTTPRSPKTNSGPKANDGV